MKYGAYETDDNDGLGCVTKVDHRSMQVTIVSGGQ